jgi:transcriptional regulator with XRE-family HTH domain
MDQTHISRIENGTIRHPSRRALQPLAGALGLQVSDLQTGDADDEPERAVA